MALSCVVFFSNKADLYNARLILAQAITSDPRKPFLGHKVAHSATIPAVYRQEPDFALGFEILPGVEPGNEQSSEEAKAEEVMVFDGLSLNRIWDILSAKGRDGLRQLALPANSYITTSPVAA